MSLLNFLLRYCRSPYSTKNTFSFLLFSIYLFAYFLWFTLLQLVYLFTEKIFDRHLFSVKCRYKSVSVILYLNFSTNSSYFFYCVTFICTMQCNSRWNTSNHQAEQKQNKNWSILMSSQDITLLLCPVNSSHGVLISACFKHVNKFFW